MEINFDIECPHCKKTIKRTADDPPFSTVKNCPFCSEPLKFKSASDNVKSILDTFGATNLLERFNTMEKPYMPEIRMSQKSQDCPAAPVCESIGNLRKSCKAGSLSVDGPGVDSCIAGVLLLISRVSGMWPQEMIDEVEAARKIGFARPSEDE